MTLKELFIKLESNYEITRQRLLNDNLMNKFIIKFLDDKTFEELKTAVKNNDTRAAFKAAHTLKGVAGNVGLDKLYDAAFELCESLRNSDSQINLKLYKKVEENYNKAISLINEYKNATN